MLTALCASLIFSLGQGHSVGLISNPSFVEQSGGAAVGWKPYEAGYSLGHAGRTDSDSIVCRSASSTERKGAFAVIALNQKVAEAVEVTGWSKAEDVAGQSDGDYSIYLDATYTDGDHLWGTFEPFASGTHGWQRKDVMLTPAKPVRELTVYALFRNHSGTAWFDDFQARVLSGNDVFDGQVLPSPRLPAGQNAGWFLRDFASASPLVPAAGAASIGLSASVSRTGQGMQTLTVHDLRRRDREISIYYCERLRVDRPRWWYSVRRSADASSGESETVTATRAGAAGTMSMYPFACVTGAGKGGMIAIPPSLGPRIARLFYHANGALLVAAFDVSLLRSNLANPSKATAAIYTAGCDPRWGFRDAADRYYRRFPDAFARRTSADGIWMPFTDPGTVKGVSDFGIAFHEGDNSPVGDAKLGILSFRYTEPMTWWMPMKPELPRTYSAALDVLKENLDGENAENRKWAQAVENSGTHAADGRFNVEFQNQPWANGAVWVLNPNPHLPLPDGQWNKARLSYTKLDADKRYAPGQKLSGEYLDSSEGWSDWLDFRPSSLASSQVPATFARDDSKPAIPQWFSTYELMAFMSHDLRSRGKLLMANTTPSRLWSFMPLLDVAGIETNWNPGGQWEPDGDDVFCYRRTLSYHKPYLLLQNTDFKQFTPDMVRRYFERSMAYAVFPSMFSADAATSPYWENPKLYDRDRPLFKRYIPMIRRLSAAGWEPLTYATSSDARVYVERFGRRYFTVFNDSKSERTAVVAVDLKRLGANTEVLKDAFSGKVLGTAGSARLTIAPESCEVLEVTSR